MSGALAGRARRVTPADVRRIETQVARAGIELERDVRAPIGLTGPRTDHEIEIHRWVAADVEIAPRAIRRMAALVEGRCRVGGVDAGAWPVGEREGEIRDGDRLATDAPESGDAADPDEDDRDDRNGGCPGGRRASPPLQGDPPRSSLAHQWDGSQRPFDEVEGGLLGTRSDPGPDDVVGSLVLVHRPDPAAVSVAGSAASIVVRSFIRA